MNNSLHSCNGGLSAYRVGEDTWNTTYISNDGDELEIDVFYATYQNQLWVRHLQVCLASTVRSTIDCQRNIRPFLAVAIM